MDKIDIDRISDFEINEAFGVPPDNIDISFDLRMEYVRNGLEKLASYDWECLQGMFTEDNRLIRYHVVWFCVENDYSLESFFLALNKIEFIQHKKGSITVFFSWLEKLSKSGKKGAEAGIEISKRFYKEIPWTK